MSAISRKYVFFQPSFQFLMLTFILLEFFGEPPFLMGRLQLLRNVTLDPIWALSRNCG